MNINMSYFAFRMAKKARQPYKSVLKGYKRIES